VLDNLAEMKQLSRNRTAYVDQKSGTIIIRDPAKSDGGTAFRPGLGKYYYDEVLK
jgi:hypothetical protein